MSASLIVLADVFILLGKEPCGDIAFTTECVMLDWPLFE